MTSINCPSCAKPLNGIDPAVECHATCPNCGVIAFLPNASGTPPDEGIEAPNSAKAGTSLERPSKSGWFSSLPSLNSTFNLASQKLEAYWPPTRDYLAATLATIAKDVARDDDKLTQVFEGAYEILLPLPVRLVVSRTMFVQFCFARRDQIFSSGEQGSTVSAPIPTSLQQ